MKLESVRVSHGSFLALLQPLPVLLQGADGVPRLTTRPPQRAVRKDVLGVHFCRKNERSTKRVKDKKKDPHHKHLFISRVHSNENVFLLKNTKVGKGL